MTESPYGPPEYPPAVYAPAVPEDLTTAPPASLLRWFASPALAGVVVGLLWWLVAPGGAFYGSGSDTSTWVPRDLLLGALGAAAGIVTACFLLPQRRHPAAWTKIVAAVLGCAAGSVIAWRLGILAGAWWGHAPDHPANASSAFSLRSLSILLLWPGLCALVLFLASLGSLLGSGAEKD